MCKNLTINFITAKYFGTFHATYCLLKNFDNTSYFGVDFQKKGSSHFIQSKIPTFKVGFQKRKDSRQTLFKSRKIIGFNSTIHLVSPYISLLENTQSSTKIPKIAFKNPKIFPNIFFEKKSQPERLYSC